jgi:hypothetical protein
VSSFLSEHLPHKIRHAAFTMAPWAKAFYAFIELRPDRQRGYQAAASMAE